MSIFGSSLNINPSSLGHLSFTSDTNYNCVSKNYYVKTNTNFNVNSSKNITLDSITGYISVIVNDSYLNLSSNGNLSNAIIISATNSNGGILQTSGSGGIKNIANNGDIDLLSKGQDINIGLSSIGTPEVEQTQNINLDCFNNFTITSGDMYFVSSDIISFVSQTGDIQFGTSTNSNPILKFENGNILINQTTSNLDYQLDIAITDSSNSNHGYNGIMINTKMSNVAADLTLQTSNTLGDGTQCILSIGTFSSDNNHAIFNKYTAYQINNAIIRSDSDTYNPNSLSFNNGKDFIYTDIGRQIYWPSINRNDTIIGLSSMITPINDSSNVTISGTYNGETSRIYLLVIDSIGIGLNSHNTFKWSNNGGYTYEKQLIPIPSIPTPISLDSNISITFINTTGFKFNQQFLFQTKITALVDTNFTISNPIPLYLLQPFYAYINTSTPSDLVIKTNNHEKMRITGDGAIGIQQNIPKASLDLNSNYNKVINVNQSITGYQVNPSITNLSSGGYVIIWNSQDSINPEAHFDIIAQRYLTDGSKYGDNFQVNIQQRNNQSFPTVACSQITNSNHYIVTWVNVDTNANLYYIYCQIYHNNLPIRIFDIQITSSTNILSNPRVAGLYNGNYIVVWDQDNGSGILNIFGCIVIDNTINGLTINTPFPINPTTPSVSRTFPFVIGLPSNDTYTPNGFVVAYMTAINTNPDPQYTISLRVFNSIGDPTTNEIAITSISSNQYSNISDGLVSLAEINNNNVNGTNGGFIITFYRSYLADTSLYQGGDSIEGLISGATARLSTTIPPNPSLRQITIDNLSNRFLVSEEIRINSTIPNIGNIIEKISAITFDPVLNQATITLDRGSKDIEAYRFNSNLASFNDSLWSSSPVVNTSPLYNDLDRFTSNSFIFQYKRPMSYVTIDNEGTALITWSNDSIPSIYYQLIDVETGSRIGIEQKLTTEYNGLKQRNQVATQLQSIQGNDCGFVIAWDNQSISLNLQDTGIYQQLIGYKHSLLNLEDGNSNFTFNHNNQLGIGTTNPESSLHVKTKLNDNSNDDPPNPAIIILQNTSQHVITNQDLQTIQFRDGSNNILNKIQSINSLRYDDLYPQPNNLIGFYKFDETQGSQVKDYSIYNTNHSNTTSYINTNGILNNFNLETCWVPGIINNSLLFNGQNNYIFIEKTASNNLNTVLEQTAHQLSISIWINIPSDMIINSNCDIVSNGGSETIPGTFILMISDNNNDGTLRLLSGVSVHDPSDVNIKYPIITYTSIINDSQWHHIVLTINVNNDIGNINTYIDGILQQTNSLPGSITAIQHDYTKTYIGSRDGNTNYFRGNIDELRFYNSILTPTEITQLYNYGNPNQPAKASLILSPNSTPTHNQSIVIDDNGIINNLSSRPLPYTLLNGSLTAYNYNSNILGSDTNFMNELTVGDIIVLGNDEFNNKFTVINIIDNTHLTLDRRGYSGVEANITFQSVLRLPSIYTFYDNSDSIRGNIDNYGNLMIGKSKPSTMLEISGVSGNYNSIPAITITNTSIENSDQSRQSALNFRSYDATNSLNPFVNLGSIETSHYGSGVDNKASMKFIINNGDSTGTNSTNLISLTSNGIGFGGETVPLTLLHAVTQSSTEECSLLLQSSYVKYSSNTPSIFDERSNIYFGGGVTINDNSGDIKSRVLCSISGSKDTTLNVAQGRLDFNTNNNNPVSASNKYFLESRMCIVNTGNVGIDIKTPANIFNVGPELRYQGIKTYIDSTSTNGTVITLHNNVFAGMTLEQKKMFFGGSLIVENNEYTRCTIESVDLTGGINNILTVNSNISTYIGEDKKVTIHYAGLNVVKHTGTYSGSNYTTNAGFIGINTTSPGSVLGVNGSLSLPIIKTSSNITVDCTHHTVICDATTTSRLITLPSNNNSIYGRIYILRKIGSNLLYINPNGCKIDDIIYTSPPYYTVTTSFIHLQSDGTDWWIVG
jgi:hypothetical protein